jgi:hypothetical protein
MKRTLVPLFVLAMSAAHAQTWTATDINGTTHVLQDYLDQGKTVLVDVSAYWCIPCWAWHRSGINERIFEEFGPGGTDDVMVFFVDGDAASSIYLLQGGAGSVGDWTLGTDYPIIGPGGEGAAVAAAYGVQSFPTLFLHCPGSVTAVEIDGVDPWEEFLGDWRTTCPAAFENGVVDAHLLDVDDKEFCSSEHPVTDVFNQGSGPLTNATLELLQNGDVLETLEWDGSIPPFEHQQVSFPNTTITSNGSYEARITVAGDAEPLGNSQSMEFTLAPIAPGALVSLELRTDGAPAETAWQLLDQDGIVVDHDPPGSYAANTTYTTQWSLGTNGCYTFRLMDQTGDGICCDNGNGYYRLQNTYGTPEIFTQGGEFHTFSEERDFETPATVGMTEAVNGVGVTLAPDPTTDLVRITLPTGAQEPTTIGVFDLRGTRVSPDRGATGQSPIISLGSLENGIYYLRISNPSLIAMERVVVHH